MLDHIRDFWFGYLLVLMVLAVMFILLFAPLGDASLKHGPDGQTMVEVCIRAEWFGTQNCQWLEVGTS